MSAYSSEANVTVNAIQGTTTGITALQTGLVSVNNQIQEIGNAITQQGNVMDTMIASIGVTLGSLAIDAVNAFGEVEQSMKIVQMISQATSGDIRYLTEQANQLSIQYRLAIDDITEGLQTLGRAGLHSAQEQTEVLENGLQTAKLEGRDLNGVLEELIQNTALLGGNLKSSNFGEQTDYVNDLLIATSLSAPIDTHAISETLKYSGGMLAAAGGDINTKEGKELIEDYMGAVAAFAQKGVSGSVAGTALRAFFNKPATQDSSVLEGLSQIHLNPEYLWEDGGERMKPVSDQIALIQGQMDKLNISTMDQMQIWSKIVGGKMGQQMMKLDSSSIKELTNDIQNSASAEELATKSMQTFESSVKQMEQTAQSVFRGFGGEVAKALYVPIKLVTHLLELFNNPIGSTVLFTGFVTILKKTLQIGWRFVKVFAEELKDTLAQGTGQAGSQVKEQIGSSKQYAEEASDNVKNKISDDIDELGNKFDSRMDTSAKKILKVFDEATGKFLYALNPSKYNFNNALNDVNNNIEANNIPQSSAKDYMYLTAPWNFKTPENYQTFYNNQERYQFKLAELQFKRRALDQTRRSIHLLSEGDIDIAPDNKEYRRRLRVERENLVRGMEKAMYSLSTFMELASEPPEVVAKEYDENIRALQFKKSDLESQERYLTEGAEQRNRNFFYAANEKAEEKYNAIKIAPMFARWDHEIATQNTIPKQEEELPGHMLDNYSIKSLAEKGWLNIDNDSTKKNFKKIIDNNIKIQELQMQYMNLQSQQAEQLAKMTEDASVNINDFNNKNPNYKITADLSDPDELLNDVLLQKENIEKELKGESGVETSLKNKKQFIEEKYILAAKQKRDELYREGKDRGAYQTSDGKKYGPLWTQLATKLKTNINKAIKNNTFEDIDIPKNLLNKLPEEDKNYWNQLVNDVKSDKTIQSIPGVQTKVTELSNALKKLNTIEKQLNSGNKNITRQMDRIKEDIKKSKRNIENAKGSMDNIIGYNMGEVQKNGTPQQITLKAQIDSIESEIRSLKEAQEALVQKYHDKLNDLTHIPEEDIWDLEKHQKLVKSAENDLVHITESKEYQGRQKRIEELEQKRKEKQKQYDLSVPWEQTSEGEKYIKDYGDSQKIRNMLYKDHLENKNKNLKAHTTDLGLGRFLNITGGDFGKEGQTILAQAFTPQELKELNEQADLSVDQEALKRSREVLLSEITQIKSDIDDMVADKKAVLKGDLPARIQDLKAEIELYRKEIQTIEEEMSILEEKDLEEIKAFNEYIDNVERELGVVDEVIEKHINRLPKGVTPKEWLDLKLSNPFNTTSVTEWDKKQWDKNDWDKMPGEAEFKKHSMPNPFENYQETFPSGFYALEREEKLRWLQAIKSRSSDFGATKKDEMNELAKSASKSAKFDPDAPIEDYALPASVNVEEIKQLEQKYMEKHTGFFNRLKNVWKETIRGLDAMPDEDMDGTIYNTSVKKQKKQSASTLFGGIKNFAVSGFKEMLRTFFSPTMIAFEGLNLTTQLLQQAQEQYAKKIGDLSDQLDEAVKKRDDAERQIKDEYANAHPGATDDEKEAYLDQIYANAADSTSHMNKLIDEVGLSTLNFPEYEKDDKEVGVLHEIKQEEQSSGEKIAENTRTLLFAGLEIVNSIDRLSSLMSDPIWGTEGIWAKLQDIIDDFSSIISTENANESGTFNTPSKMKSDDYAGYTEEAGVLTEQLGYTDDTWYNQYQLNEQGHITRNDNFHDKQGNLKKNYLDDFIQNRLEEIYPKAGKETWGILSEHAKNQLRDQTRIFQGLSPTQRNSLSLSQKEDKKNYQKIGKEMAKAYKGDKKALDRISRLVDRIQGNTATNLKKQTIMAAAALQQFQDMKNVAQSVITPLLLEQVQLGVQYAAYGKNTMSSNSSISGSSGTTAANAQIIATFLANQAADESYKAAFDYFTEHNATNANTVDEFKKEIANGAVTYSKDGQTLLDKKRSMVAEGVMFPAIKQQHPDWSDSQVSAEAHKRWNQHASDNFSDTMEYARKSLANVLDDIVIDAYSNSDIGSDTDGGSSGGGGSGGGGSGSGGSSDKSGTKKDRVDLVLCSKKQIPKLDVNLFKKAPQFTILNKNFRLRDIKISTKDKPKAVLDSIKNAIIDTQQRMDPKIIQDEDAEYNPADATEGKSLPAGSTNTSTK